LLDAAAADVVHEEQRAAANEDEQGEQHEGEAAGPVALLARVDELLRARRGSDEQRG
jgi:hypothetical protein